MKSKENKHVLVVDENVSHNIIRIFELYLGGRTARAIADLFNSEEIPTSNEYYYNLLGKPNPYRNNKNKWGSATIMNIIKNPVYYGAMANGKRQVKSFKNDQVARKPVKEWIIVEDTHTPIVSKEMWLNAQQIHLSNKKNTVKRCRTDGEVSIFAGIIKCADCRGNMALKRRVNKTIGTKEFYKCGTYAQKGKKVCSAHTIDFEVLSQVVLADIQRYAVLAVEDEKKLIDQILEANNAFRNKNLARYEKTIRQSKNRTNEIDKILQNLYEDKLSGEITTDIFKRMSQKYRDEQMELIAEVEQLEKELYECKNIQQDISVLVKRIKECLSIDTLTRAIVIDLIDKIEISETYSVDGEKNIDISIDYKFKHILDEEKEPVEV